jgi:hypothetical protein
MLRMPRARRAWPVRAAALVAACVSSFDSRPIDPAIPDRIAVRRHERADYLDGRQHRREYFAAESSGFATRDGYVAARLVRGAIALRCDVEPRNVT